MSKEESQEKLDADPEGTDSKVPLVDAPLNASEAFSKSLRVSPNSKVVASESVSLR
jgi:hypothetical protein